ncbi:GAF domain-containing protein [Roseofilum casamattae]|uniref:GAF domain-containing protein n=1 Tax=Roseofilum casamattae BLCC-M143 TaxID=3022442 RepID=A0ABT7BXX9_9CYAN|nr:GAF domain-containing protein [Roseofilum casamattae]MDJ1183920.1 GAF domain-containing protein [Roseofilum casamattae BLCC-M143]
MSQESLPKQAEKQLVTLGRTLQTLREEENLDVLIETTLNYVETEFAYDLIWIGLYDRREHRLFGKGGQIPAGGDRSILKQTFSLSPGDLFEQVVIQQKPASVPDLREERRAGDWRRLATKLNVQGTIIFPLRYRALCFGVVILGNPVWGASPRSDEKARLSMIFGELAAALNEVEAKWRREVSKQPDKPLLELLDRLRSLSDFRARLDAVVAKTHNFISPNRTNIYWFERERRYFWRRTGNLQKTPAQNSSSQGSSGITVQEVIGFYKALASDRLVSVGEARSSLKADTTSRLMQQIKARSMLAAPIIYQNELLGFLAVEGNEPRIWEEAERSYVRGAAQLIALMAPLEAMEVAVERAKQDQALTAELVRSIYSEDDWRQTLDRSAHLLCNRLGVERFLVLRYDRDYNVFEIICQSQPNTRRPVTSPLPFPDLEDWKWIDRSTSAISIENWDEEDRLIDWRSQFTQVGIRSLALCSTAIGHPIEALLAVGHDVTRNWDSTELELVRVVAQQLGLVLRQWQLHTLQRQQESLQSLIQWGQQASVGLDGDREALEEEAISRLSKVFNTPLALKISWSADNPHLGYITSAAITNVEFSVNANGQIDLTHDPLIQTVLARPGIHQLDGRELSPLTQQWLSGPSIGNILAIAFQGDERSFPLGIIILADASGRSWDERYLTALEIVVRQLAWSERIVKLSDRFYRDRDRVRQLNWYKQRRSEVTYRKLSVELKKLGSLGTPKDALTTTRYQQGLRSINATLSNLAQMLKDEQWELQRYQMTMPLVSLIKRALDRVDGLVKKRELFIRVQGQSAGINLTGDVLKLELIFHEILGITCRTAVAKSQVDIWCNGIAETEVPPHVKIATPLFDLSIVCASQLEGNVISEFQQGRSPDVLSPSLLDKPPGLFLFLCQSMIQHLGGNFNIYKLEENQVMLQLLLPIEPSV